MNDANIDVNRSEVSRGRQFDSSSESNQIFYVPGQVSDDHAPKLGQEFLSLEEVLDFYNAYAKKKAGFSVRINSSKRSKDNNEILRKEYVYSKEGKTSTKVISGRKRASGYNM
ncbi:hypothetical protein LWI28_009119 [Acer negundo]|uniref:FAR1 domain-containing protein n=1 Tax=Acer negundo TaxID=4023 RepID=A0AAD5IPJ2_ACENE|nr:hypothetical protein LWI28_009119 [Acer negundo]